MNFLWVSPGSSTMLVAAALGVIAGLYLFFRGFWLLGHKRPVAAKADRTQPVITTITTSSSPGENDKPAGGSGQQIIRLSPASGAEPAPTTQQGKIAAALLRAGIANRASWSEEEPHGSVHIATATKGNGTTGSLPALDVDSAMVVRQTPVEADVNLPDSAPGNSALRWTPTLMVWGGPVLTVLSVYILARRMGWL